MRQDMSVSWLLAELEARAEHHEKQEAHHAEREVFHREERARHAAELQSAREKLVAFRSAAEAAGDLVARSQILPAAPLEDELPPGASLRISSLAMRVMSTRGPDETFGGASMAREINQRYGKRLRRPAKVRNVATALRRMAASGYIRRVQDGRAYHEALYARWED
jgi:hypothetical protein